MGCAGEWDHKEERASDVRNLCANIGRERGSWIGAVGEF